MNPLYAQYGQSQRGNTTAGMHQSLTDFNQNATREPSPCHMTPLQIMQNPAAFIRNRFPDIPADMNDPNQMLQYLQQSRNIPIGQIQSLMSRFPPNMNSLSQLLAGQVMGNQMMWR